MLAINKPKKHDNAISAYKLPPRDRSIFNVNRQNNYRNDHRTCSKSAKKSEWHDRATIGFH